MAKHKEKLQSNEIGYIDDIKEAILKQSPRYARYSLYLILALVISSILWARYAVIDIVTVANGKISSASSLQVIQNLEGGIIKSIEAKEGVTVKKGQVLARFDDTRFNASYQRDLAKKAVLEIEMIRLRAQTNSDNELVIPAELQKSNPTLVQHAIEHYQKDQRSINEQIDILKNSEALLMQELKIVRPLAEKGAISQLEKIKLERELNAIKSQIKGKQERFRNEARKQLNAVKSEYTVLIEQIAASKDRTHRTVIRSPVDGVVNKVYISTIGQVITPGAKIMDIVPTDDRVSIVLRVTPTDIGFLKVGQKATVKVTAYDYATYGSIEAKISNIGADAISNKNGEDYYEVKLQTKTYRLGSKNQPLRIMPGMAVTANILTGERTILSFLIKPFIDINETAFKSR